MTRYAADSLQGRAELTAVLPGQSAQMTRIDDDLDEMDVQLGKGQKEVTALGQGFAKGFAKDVAGFSGRKLFGGGKKSKEAEQAAQKAAAEQERLEREERDQRRAEERAAKSSGASHMAAAADSSKFATKGVSPLLARLAASLPAAPVRLQMLSHCALRSRARSGTDRTVRPRTRASRAGLALRSRAKYKRGSIEAHVFLAAQTARATRRRKTTWRRCVSPALLLCEARAAPRARSDRHAVVCRWIKIWTKWAP